MAPFPEQCPGQHKKETVSYEHPSLSTSCLQMLRDQKLSNCCCWDFVAMMACILALWAKPTLSPWSCFCLTIIATGKQKIGFFFAWSLHILEKTDIWIFIKIIQAKPWAQELVHSMCSVNTHVPGKADWKFGCSTVSHLMLPPSFFIQRQ